MAGDIRVGTSGWQYDDWDGRFYPHDVARTRWFDHYARIFPTVEVNYSFYRLPRTSTTQRWHDRAPNRFRYACKGSRYVTHNLKLGEGSAEAVGNVMERMAPLKTFLAVMLWQLPPNLGKDVPRLDRSSRSSPRAWVTPWSSVTPPGSTTTSSTPSTGTGSRTCG
ncbi:MAG: DUF72 domain-containing protein [Actinobacteria bacterium]|nr:DUF72 domain-containing protein [Actinomycetota bacterium]